MTVATGIGSMPGEDLAESVRIVLGELSDLPYLPELPDRGATAMMTGRALAVVAELAADLQPAGWRLTGTGAGSGVDHRRARSLLAQDLDVLEELGQDCEGAFKVQVAGPWTLAATVEKPRGDKVVSDHGARRELAQGLAEGLGVHVGDLRRRLPGVDRLIVQIDEPALPAVLNGAVRTASGFGRHRVVHPPEISELLSASFAAVREAGAEPWLHSCAPGVPWGLVHEAGAAGLCVDPTVLSAADLNDLAEAVEAGVFVALGQLPSIEPATVPTESQVTESVLRWLDMLGLDPAEVQERLLLTPACGLAGASPAWVRQALRLATVAARNLSA